MKGVYLILTVQIKIVILNLKKKTVNPTNFINVEIQENRVM